MFKHSPLPSETEVNITDQPTEQTSVQVEPEIAYITDNLFVYLHSDPSKNTVF